MKRLLIAAVMTLALVVAQGCGDDSLSKQDAQKVLAAATTASAEAQASVWTGMYQAPEGADSIEVEGFTFEWTDTTFSFAGTVDGIEGGSAEVTGTGSFDEANDYATFDFSMIFVGYVSQGIVLDGELAMSFEGGKNYYKLTYAGAVDASGAVDGTASFALTMEITEQGITYKGTVGGQKIGGSVNYDDYGIPS